MMKKNFSKIILAVTFSTAFIFTSCSEDEPTIINKANPDEWTENTWIANKPTGKMSIAVDEDEYNGLLKNTSEKPTSKISIKTNRNRSLLNIDNKEFADFIYVPQNIELISGDSYFYTTIDLSKTTPGFVIEAKDHMIMNESFPLVTNIAYSTLKKVDIDKYAPMIDPMIASLGTNMALKYITQEGGLHIAAMGITLEYTEDMTLKDYLAQVRVPMMGMQMPIGPILEIIVKNLGGETITDEFIANTKITKAMPVLIPSILQKIKPLSINQILDLAVENTGGLSELIKANIQPIIENLVPEQMRDIPLIAMQNSLIEGTKYIQANLKTAMHIEEFVIQPTISTVSLKKINNSNHEFSDLINTMNFKFVSLKLSPIKDDRLPIAELMGLNQLLIPALNYGIPMLLNNPYILPENIGNAINMANDFNYTITSPLTKN